MATATEPQLMTYREVQDLVGISKRTLIDRIKTDRIPVYVDGVDRRRRLIDARDVEKMIAVRPRPERVA